MRVKKALRFEHANVPSVAVMITLGVGTIGGTVVWRCCWDMFFHGIFVGLKLITGLCLVMSK